MVEISSSQVNLESSLQKKKVNLENTSSSLLLSSSKLGPEYIVAISARANTSLLSDSLARFSHVAIRGGYGLGLVWQVSYQPKPKYFFILIFS